MGLPKEITQGATPLGVAFTLWSISGLITVSLFLDLAGDNLLRQAVAGLWAASLEATKVVTWRRGRRYRWLAVCLIGLTLLSALGVAVQTVETTRADRHRTKLQSYPIYQLGRAQAEELQRSSRILADRLEALPPDYITAAGNLTKSLELAQTRMETAKNDLKAAETAPLPLESTDPFTQVAQFLHWDRTLLEIVIILAISLLTEASAMVMASLVLKRPADSPNTHTVSPDNLAGESVAREITAEDYLRAALDHPNAPRLLGREAVATRLGITVPHARKLLYQLVQSGRIRRESKSFQVK